MVRLLIRIPVTFHMKAPVQSHDSHRLLLSWSWHDWMTTHRAARCKPPVEVINAVDLVCSIHSEGNSIQTLGADHAGETVGMIWLASSSENSVKYWLETFAASLQSVEIICLTQRFPIN